MKTTRNYVDCLGYPSFLSWGWIMPVSKSLRVCSLLTFILLSACIGPMRPLRNGQIGTISGHETAGLSAPAAQKKILSEAAQLTVDHGFRYFVLLSPPDQQRNSAASIPQRAQTTATPGASLHPGMDVNFRAFRKGQINPRITGVWDAFQVLNARNKDVSAKQVVQH